MPDVDECVGLLALLLATHARQAARLDDEGNLVLLADQDRSKWDREAIDEAAALVADRLRRGAGGPYLVQAAISSAHGLAATAEDTNWARIAGLYRLLEARQPTAVVRVNRAVAEAEAFGPQAGLDLLATVEGAEHWHLWWSAQAALLARLGEDRKAADAYRSALQCEMNDTDRAFMEAQMAKLT
jgi:RNA polymerase sigma-70 factor (ECF subfamily)